MRGQDIDGFHIVHPEPPAYIVGVIDPYLPEGVTMVSAQEARTLLGYAGLRLRVVGDNRPRATIQGDLSPWHVISRMVSYYENPKGGDYLILQEVAIAMHTLVERAAAA